MDPVESARSAHLRYVSDDDPGIRRRRAGRGFSYRGIDGETIRDEETLRRIKSLAIPPAWTDVWICPDPRGHIQATGRDARGRKQYRYHPRWREERDSTKYERLLAFGRALPRIRARVEDDLARRELSREKVLATIVRLLEASRERVGNREYARENGSYGLTTLRDRHARIIGTRVHLHFRGKSGKAHDVDVHDRRLAAAVRCCQDLPGQELFQYVGEDDERHRLESDDVNTYLREVSGQDFTAKDFRTWAGTVLAAEALCVFEGEPTKTNVVRAIEAVAAELRNTPAVCRKCYVHPAVIDAYLQGQLHARRDPEQTVMALLKGCATLPASGGKPCRTSSSSRARTTRSTSAPHSSRRRSRAATASTRL